ncbi:aminotransferase class I/II-fold pyridoxal phosphate-dependent enzyme [Engelhardtia mirabilis]|uniref:dTDP-4-amino-4,6-dideoxy-D-glucose transaminase n=1 Tax=Engelhardtia mirabilis TaxID=2528011 RepID=A0A518BNB9_9BACT|nr:dTDP-4-amino-4,6-dideoxy-D-glucose transaminase [Planctomycetes bacterium Pla133]QDV02782.1 dTDP-4-amino-4,6-dideoxy-D-glucose transaminase [Planctomycetes bacterium Pla86]
MSNQPSTDPVAPESGPIHAPHLALLGAPPVFEAPLHVGRPNIGDRARFMSRVEKILDSAWLTNNGPYVRDFERRVAELAGTRHAVAMCNATIALEIVIRALGMKGEVIVPSFTFVATAHALQWQEIKPIFCDVDPVTHNLDPARVEQLITPQTTGIIGVHVWGRPCAVEALQEIADRRGLQLIFDAAHALGCSHGGRPIGSFGRAEVFSFHATKVCNSFEGGMVTTDDDELAEKLRLMRNFGFAGKDQVIYLGSNGKMSEVSAAMGLTSLDGFEEFRAHNAQIHAAYTSGLADLPGLTVIQYDGAEHNNHQYVVVEIDGSVAPLNRDQLVKVLEAEGVLARRYFYPGVHEMEPYRSNQPTADLVLPETRCLSERVMTLPTGTAMHDSDVRTLCGVVHRAFDHADEVVAHLTAAEA